MHRLGMTGGANPSDVPVDILPRFHAMGGDGFTQRLLRGMGNRKKQSGQPGC